MFLRSANILDSWNEEIFNNSLIGEHCCLAKRQLDLNYGDEISFTVLIRKENSLFSTCIKGSYKSAAS